MDRQITAVGQSVYEWNFSKPDQNAMVALAKLAGAVLGISSATANGLACTATAPASLQVQIGAGELYQLAPLEATVCGTLPVDTLHTILKQGILLDPVLLTCTAPTTAGQSINYLVQAAYQDQDVSVDPTTGVTPVVLQFWDAANPSQPWSGPNNSSASSNTFRKGVVNLQLKAGASAPTGSQATPTPDTGYVGLYVITVANGQTAITSSSIAVYSGAPFLSETLQQKISTTAGDARYGRLGAANTWAGAQAFSAGAIGNLTGNASTASKWASAITLSFTGAAIGSGSVDGSGNVPINLTLAAGSIPNSALATMAAGTIKGNNTGSTGAPLDLTGAQVAAMLPNGSLTNAQLANAPATTLKGNNTGSGAAPTDLTVSQVLTLLGLTAGAMPTSGKSSWEFQIPTPSGNIIVQGGYYSGPVNESPYTVTFGTAFASACWGAFAILDGVGASVPTGISVSTAPTTTSVSFQPVGYQSGTVNAINGFWWFAIGK